MLTARGVLEIHRQQLEDLHRALPVTVGQEGEAVGERLRCNEIVSLDDRVADQVAGWPFGAVIANGGTRSERAADVDERRPELLRPAGKRVKGAIIRVAPQAAAR
jgi:hypothetical protein